MKNRYVVGYSGRGNCVYGSMVDNEFMYVDPMDLKQASRYIKRNYCYVKTGREYMKLYKLVEVKKNGR